VINVLDVPWENIIKHFPIANKFINEALTSGTGVLVHCYAGVSRSAAFVIAYLMSNQKMGMVQAMSLVK